MCCMTMATTYCRTRYANVLKVMSQYGLGPNGAITTSLNLFATRFDQVLDLLEKRSDDLE